MTALVLLDIALVLVLARVAGCVARRLGQPAVVGEIAAGILLGPTLWGGAVASVLLPPLARSALGALAVVGLVLFLVDVGHEMDHRILRGRLGTALTVATGSAVVPFALASALAVGLLVTWRPHPEPVLFVAFLGVAMAVTALPVLARIMADHEGLASSAAGRLALAAATVVDVLAWSALAVVVALAGGAPPWRMMLVLPFAVLVVVAGRPALRALLARRRGPAAGAVVVVGAFLAAAAAEWLGVHYVFGALLFGAVLPRTPPTREVVTELSRLSATALLPVFFVLAAVEVDLSRLAPADLGVLAAVVAVAIAGKIGGTYGGARLCGVPRPVAGTTAVLMNARGLTELVVLQIGLSIGILDPSMYAILVVMAIVTTAVTGPLLRLQRWSDTGPTTPLDEVVGGSGSAVRVKPSTGRAG